MSELKYNEPAERFAPIVEKSLCAGASAVMVPSEIGCWVHYVEYCERIANIKSEADKVIEHQKRKRCEAMAEMCNARYDEEDEKVNGYGASWVYISKEMKYYARWIWLWQELAEEPTWAKFLQLIHKEAK